MIIDIRCVIVLCCIVWFDQKRWFIRLLQQQMTSGRTSCWQPTTKVIVVWNAVWSVLQWYHSLFYINYECRKYLMHLVLLYIKKLMVCLFEFLQCAFVYNWIDLTHTMLLCCLIHFRFLKGMIWLRTLALLIVASYCKVFTPKERVMVAPLFDLLARPDAIAATQDCSKGTDLLSQWKRDDWQSILRVENNMDGWRQEVCGGDDEENQERPDFTVSGRRQTRSSAKPSRVKKRQRRS